MLLKICSSLFSAVAFTLTYRWLIFYENKDTSFNKQHLLPSAIDDNESLTWEIQCENTQLKI